MCGHCGKVDYGAGSVYACESQLSAAVTLKKEQEQVTNCLEPSSKPSGIKSVQSPPPPSQKAHCPQMLDKDKFAIWSHILLYMTCPILSLQVLLMQRISDHQTFSNCWTDWSAKKKKMSWAKSTLCNWISGSAGNRWPCGYQNSAPHIRAVPHLN